MKLVVAFVAVAIVAVSAAPQYTTKYDSVNVDNILKNERVLKNYVNCLLGKGICTPDADALKKVLPDAIQTGCEKCNKKQKEGAEKAIRFIVDNKPEYWKELADKYDPDKKYRVKWENEAKDLGIQA